jgi:hypothetical protein
MPERTNCTLLVSVVVGAGVRWESGLVGGLGFPDIWRTYLGITELRILFTGPNQGPKFLYDMSNRTVWSYWLQLCGVGLRGIRARRKPIPES